MEEVIGHYKAGSRTTKKAEFAGVGSENPLKSNFVSGLKLTVQRTARLAEFPDKFNKGLIDQQPRFEIPEFTLFFIRQ